ncbi:FIST signal transduction protein [Roseococcus sp. DSY-14]|uniref:FIST signal transduction protein n=1 Tax=Roseococcus sp. DSY-14 TaxID=3369650 RepID=UPI00387A8E98
MTDLVRIGYGKSPDTALAVRQAVAALGDCTPTLLLVFAGGKLDPAAALAALGGAFAGVPVVGGSAAGAIARGGLGYSGFEIGILAFCDPATTPELVVGHGLDAGERAAGAAIGARVRALAQGPAAVLLLFDSVASAQPLRLHHASSIVAGFNDAAGDAPLTVIGGGLLTDMNMSGAWVFDGAAVRKHAVIALVFPPSVVAETVILHGCRPVSAFMEITRIDGATIFELDGQPALRIIERMLGLPIGGTPGHGLTLIATLGQKQGDIYAPYDENAYVNRLILGADPATNAITLFEPDFERGTQVQIMSRDNGLMLDSVQRGVAAMNARMAGQDALLALYIDCAGRASARSGCMQEEAALVAEGLDPAIPLLGFYSGVEIAPFADGTSRSLDWTGVLTALRPRR